MDKMDKLDKLLKEVYDNLKPNYTSYKFADMLNVGLVMKGIKKSALVHIEDKNNLLNRLGLYHMTYPKKGLEHLTLLSKKEINITHNEDIDVNTGKILGYLTPGNLESFTKTDKNGSLIVTFRKGNGRKLVCSILNQRIKGKTNKEIMNYLVKYNNGIRDLHIPKDFTILSIKPSIE